MECGLSLGSKVEMEWQAPSADVGGACHICFGVISARLHIKIVITEQIIFQLKRCIFFLPLNQKSQTITL